VVNVLPSEGGISRFCLSDERLIPCPYTLEAVSCVSHPWAFLMAGLIVVMFIVSFVGDGNSDSTLDFSGYPVGYSDFFFTFACSNSKR
jgi:hypothetical protein